MYELKTRFKTSLYVISLFLDFIFTNYLSYQLSGEHDHHKLKTKTGHGWLLEELLSGPIFKRQKDLEFCTDDILFVLA